jgi:hypothetical protein
MDLFYALSDHAHAIFGSRATGLALLTPLVLVAIHRFWRRANEGSSDSPLEALRTDRVVLASIVLFVALLGVVLFAPQAAEALDAVFLSQKAVQTLGAGCSTVARPGWLRPSRAASTCSSLQWRSCAPSKARANGTTRRTTTCR